MQNEKVKVKEEIKWVGCFGCLGDDVRLHGGVVLPEPRLAGGDLVEDDVLLRAGDGQHLGEEGQRLRGVPQSAAQYAYGLAHLKLGL